MSGPHVVILTPWYFVVRILSISNVPHDLSQGSGFVISGYMEGLRERGHSVQAYGPSDWRCLDVHRGRRYAYPVMIALFGLVYVQPERFDLVELWGGATWLLATCLRWLHPDSTIVHHSNGIEQHRVKVQQQAPVTDVQNVHWFQFDVSPLHDWGLRASDAIVTVSSYDVPFLKKRDYVPEDRVYAIENPLTEAFLGRSVEWERPKRIGFCGNWIPRKGTHLLTTDLSSVLRENPDWTFSLVGVGDTNVKAQFPVDLHDRVEVIPFLERAELIDWYQGLAIFTLPSIYESFGLVMAEAMACGAALVSTNVGFAHGLDHRDEALILPSSQSPHLSEALTTFIENESLRRSIARNGHARVQNLRWDRAIDRLDSIYTSLIKHSSSA